MIDRIAGMKSSGSIKRTPKGKGKIRKVMREYKAGTLHSGSSKGPVVKNRKQALAIALSEQRRAERGKY